MKYRLIEGNEQGVKVVKIEADDTYSNEHFTLDSTEGYTQKELDQHNEKFEKFLVSKGFYTDEYEDAWEIGHYYIGYREKYFNDYM